MCLPYLKFSGLLPETHKFIFYLAWPPVDWEPAINVDMANRDDVVLSVGGGKLWNV